jgi:hypothetical protein
MRRFQLGLIAVAVGVAATPTSAHHGWGNYDSSKTLTLNGKIVESTYQNPHGTLKLDAPGKMWLVILAPPSRMELRGLPARMMTPGTTATVVGYAHRTEPTELRAERITIDGKTVELR